jgi:phage tail sheath protein FI
MPITPTYPGVYVEEIASGVRTITGVATSVTAFIGRAKRGPVNEAITINSFGDYERIFGGLDLKSSMSYAVRDFYLNGGSQAVIVRLYNADPGDPNANPVVPAPKTKSKLKIGQLTLEAAYEGSWGNYLRGSIDTNVSEEVAARMNLNKADLFNLTVRDTSAGGASETFLNLSVKDSPRRIDKTLKAESSLVRWDGVWPPNQLPTVQAAEDDVTGKEKALADKAKDLAVAEKELAGKEKALADAESENPPNQAKIDAAKAARDTAKTTRDTAKTARDTAKTALDTEKANGGASDGKDLSKDTFTPANGEADKKGLFALEQVFARDGLFNILCIPPYKNDGSVDVAIVSDAAAYCEKRRAILLVDPPPNWKSKTTAKNDFSDPNEDKVGTRSRNAALFFPRITKTNPLRDNQLEDFAPCGTVAGIFARTDVQRGVWKAPAGLDATLVDAPKLSVPLTDDENGELNPLGINCLRAFPVYGRVVWGARTLRGADQLADEYKYIPVRRTALYIEESLYRGLKWVVFEPNDEPLWAQIRLNAGAFLHNLFRQGAFQGKTPREAYFVKCDKETTTQNDINLGIVNVVVGFAPLKPAEFVIIKLQQIAGQIEV